MRFEMNPIYTRLKGLERFERLEPLEHYFHKSSVFGANNSSRDIFLSANPCS